MLILLHKTLEMNCVIVDVDKQVMVWSFRRKNLILAFMHELGEKKHQSDLVLVDDFWCRSDLVFIDNFQCQNDSVFVDDFQCPSNIVFVDDF